MEFLSCTYASICSGCDWLLKPASEQRDLKLENFKSTWSTVNGQTSLPSEIGWVTAGVGGSRDRIDLMIDQRTGVYKLGLFDQFRTGLVDLQGCPQLSPALEKWLQEFRQFRFPIQRGSVRLRVSPSGEKGAWLDFANVDIKTLLNERVLLDSLRAVAVVEIGQKRKRLVEKDGRLKLEDPELAPWFETYSGDRKIPLYAMIGSFTQPGFGVNRALIGETLRLSEKISTALPSGRLGRVAEFGSGIGNFTLPLTLASAHVDAYEVDTLALEGLSRTLVEQDLTEKVTIHSGNYQGEKASNLDFTGIDLLLVDPPRSGLMKFLDPLEKMTAASRPAALIYVSCFAESFALDAQRLLAMGYTLREISLVDQFPQSRHYETVAVFVR